MYIVYLYICIYVLLFTYYESLPSTTKRIFCRLPVNST